MAIAGNRGSRGRTPPHPALLRPGDVGMIGDFLAITLPMGRVASILGQSPLSATASPLVTRTFAIRGQEVRVPPLMKTCPPFLIGVAAVQSC